MIKIVDEEIIDIRKALSFFIKLRKVKVDELNAAASPHGRKDGIALVNALDVAINRLNIDVDTEIQLCLSHWLKGTTCNREERKSLFWRSDCGRFVVFKHHGHASYCGGSTGTAWCETFYALIDLNKHDHPNHMSWYGRHAGELNEWQGRWSKKKDAERDQQIREQLMLEVSDGS